MEVEFASDGDYEELPEKSFEMMCNLTHEETTEKALLEDLQAAVITYLNLYAPEIVRDDEHLDMQMAIIGYGGG